MLHPLRMLAVMASAVLLALAVVAVAVVAPGVGCDECLGCAVGG